MPTLAEALLAAPFLSRVASQEVQRTTPRWRGASLAPGAILWTEGERVEELAVVLAGSVDVDVDGVTVSTMAAGEILGEAAAFDPSRLRAATLRAREATWLARLGITELQALRDEGSPVYDAILDHALASLARRIRTLDEAIARHARGGLPQPKREQVGAVARLWKSLRPGAPSGSPPPLAPLLRRQARIRSLPADVPEAIAAAFRPRAVAEGELLFLEGEPGLEMFVLASGKIAVLRHIGAERAELLATLEDGHLFGLLPLVDPGMRSASCVATEKGWVYAVDGAGLDTLPRPVRRVWREVMLDSLVAQLQHANRLATRPQQAALAMGQAELRSTGAVLNGAIQPT